MEDLRDLFALNLRRLRAARGISQDELAAEAEMSRSYLAQIETGKWHVSLKIIAKLTAALGAEPIDFFRRPADRSHDS